MVLTYNELINKFKSDYQIQKALNNGEIYKIEPGIYSDKKDNSYLEIFTKKYPNAIISGDSAYYYHNLTDNIPKKMFITTERTSGRFNYSNIDQSYSIDNLVNEGKTTIDYDGVILNIYDKERMLVELVKNKKSMEYDYYKEIIDNYRKIVDSLDTYKIYEYTSKYYNGDRLMSMIQDEVF